ncbi:cell envelope integrity protein CreD [Endomicrobium proavitum]|uniref:Inner membrane protein involved in colicin E2 resistance n=1 Tax=Endomicrobium proavitum TaxID=1408281 RepID=A0A0G3WJ64_9BACT|nr:cell envelope integrity protein CreD [Endomicrobium proavitum]AKL98368.1 Inner membrane protein involved in colicin E2 resistance [Endomicrobium proavitum]
MKKINFMIILKAVVIGALILLMLIPLALVSNTIKGRLEYKNEATAKITKAWGDQILIAAPILNLPYTVAVKDKDEKIVSYKTEYAKFAPQDLNVDVNIISQTRYIGIFEVPVFVAEITMKGNFENIRDIANFKTAESFISLEINDLKGISTPEFLWNGKNANFEPSVKASPLAVRIPYTREYSPKSSYTRYNDYEETQILKSLSSKISLKNGSNNFEIKFSIKGSQAISFIPLAKDNNFRIRSQWTNPNFSGNFLPDTKEINGEGFDASWRINYLASAIPHRLDGANLSSALFTTSLLIPVDSYRAAERATKYGILFIILTFIACFVFETTRKKSIHPFQYLLVGFAMSVFYILLLSISEFIPFGFAYLIAAAAIISMITLYAKFAIAKTSTLKQTAAIAGAFAVLYGYLYILLQLQDMALIFGAIGLFAALAVMMYATRNINWYK